eukprot:4653372-Prymnesium_polylepis.1
MEPLVRDTRVPRNVALRREGAPMDHLHLREAERARALGRLRRGAHLREDQVEQPLEVAVCRLDDGLPREPLERHPARLPRLELRLERRHQRAHLQPARLGQQLALQRLVALRRQRARTEPREHVPERGAVPIEEDGAELIERHARARLREQVRQQRRLAAQRAERGLVAHAAHVERDALRAAAQQRAEARRALADLPLRRLEARELSARGAAPFSEV